jgi:hypothetical protein
MKDLERTTIDDLGYEAYYTGAKCPSVVKEGSTFWQHWHRGWKKAEAELKNDPIVNESLKRNA